MENLAKKYEVEYKVYPVEPVEKEERIENKVSEVFENIYFDAKNENAKFLEDTKVEAGGE
ncbi:MAG: hypothetical protein KatS3mg129_0022 [Leptospiraceae bacterium]|nr:MAG: hypothetical protein KatS3mg129_0022 [Leptospiraceae bacterium]